MEMPGASGPPPAPYGCRTGTTPSCTPTASQPGTVWRVRTSIWRAAMTRHGGYPGCTARSWLSTRTTPMFTRTAQTTAAARQMRISTSTVPTAPRGESGQAAPKSGSPTWTTTACTPTTPIRARTSHQWTCVCPGQRRFQGDLGRRRDHVDCR